MFNLLQNLEYIPNLSELDIRSIIYIIIENTFEPEYEYNRKNFMEARKKEHSRIRIISN